MFVLVVGDFSGDCGGDLKLRLERHGLSVGLYTLATPALLVLLLLLLLLSSKLAVSPLPQLPLLLLLLLLPSGNGTDVKEDACRATPNPLAPDEDGGAGGGGPCGGVVGS